jgi:beta-galactosidase
MRKPGLAACLAVLASTVVAANGYTITIARPRPPLTEGFSMGEARRPDGATLTLDSSSLLLDGKRWTPVMGEFHFARYPEEEWREELLKMKAGGIDIVSTYVFWIHHEEIEGQFDWSGSRNLRRFIQVCQETGLKAFVRCGPWDHGEVRNGGFPDWLLKKGWRTRSNDTNYLGKARILYGEIARQLDGLLWKNGGPVIGIQFENEYSGPAEHLLTLKHIGREAGLDAPIYTRTGWDQPSGRMPFGELVPLYGVYAEGFWDRVLTPMPAGYWKGFHFSHNRMDDATVSGVPGEGGAVDPPDAAKYPYLTCEIGGGMMNSYHRRILVNPKDAESTTLIKLGSGSTLPGYYMYHGGANFMNGVRIWPLCRRPCRISALVEKMTLTPCAGAFAPTDKADSFS